CARIRDYSSDYW
nr:immunoglobulin heavy chain junction region [Mus musculus]